MLQRKIMNKMMMLSAAICSVIACDLHGQELQQSIEFDNINSIHLITSSFDITTIGYDGEKVEAEFYYNDRYYIVDHETRGSQLSIKTKKRTSFSFFNDRNAKIILKVPFSTQLDISTTSGNIEILNSDAINRLHSTSGTVNIRSGSGDKEIDITSGSIHVEEIKGNLKIDATSGSIWIEKVEGNLSIDATSGKTNINEIKGSLKINKISGRIAGEKISIEGSADITTTSGNISIDFINPVEDLNLTIKTTSGEVRLGEMRLSGDLKTGSGKIPVRFSTTSGNIEID